MKRFSLAIATCFSIAAQASGALPDEQISNCTTSATVFSFAATFRDTGVSPQQNLQQMRMPQFRRGMPEGALKEIINAVYFDPDLSRMSAREVYSAVVNSCMFPPKQYTPLK
ncbi:hypothetical protein ACVCII_04175 [Burkholderia glumae]|uniref:hypothetical protein n=1 Tax=Burkholderia glumae TaxID=337 RepID=UPI002036E266|nr:hypothetical protein [Burkholderia glumae]MCM2546167.1 hypothetical protein [Burkholderia glumae]